MKYNFDKVIDRNGTAAVKLEEAETYLGTYGFDSFVGG